MLEKCGNVYILIDFMSNLVGLHYYAVCYEGSVNKNVKFAHFYREFGLTALITIFTHSP